MSYSHHCTKQISSTHIYFQLPFNTFLRTLVTRDLSCELLKYMSRLLPPYKIFREDIQIFLRFPFLSLIPELLFLCTVGARFSLTSQCTASLLRKIMNLTSKIFLQPLYSYADAVLRKRTLGTLCHMYCVETLTHLLTQHGGVSHTISPTAGFLQ